MANIFDLFEKIGTPAKESARPVSALIVGLGNPGKEYEHTRHNMGFLCLDVLSAALHVKIDRCRFRALCGEADIADRRVLLLKPQTFMNLSGESVREAAAFYKIPSDQVYVIYDDVSLEPGCMRIRQKGSAGGHNGIKNIIYQLNTDIFPRIKIGVGAPAPGADLINWVLGVLPVSQREDVGKCFACVLPALELMLRGDFDQAMCRYNGKVR